jgi:hypothetical protein
MKQEPELVDIFAMFALHAILRTAKKDAFPHDIARAAYDFAEAMMEERIERNDDV